MNENLNIEKETHTMMALKRNLLPLSTYMYITNEIASFEYDNLALGYNCYTLSDDVILNIH